MNRTIVDWYNLKDYEILYLEGKTIKDLINRAARKAGSISKLGRKLNSMHVYNILNGNKGISVKTLKSILN